MHIARLVAVEGLVCNHWLLGFEGVEVARALAAQTAAVQARKCDMGANKLARDRQQVIQGQQQSTSVVEHHGLSRRREHGLQVMGRVRAV